MLFILIQGTCYSVWFSGQTRTEVVVEVELTTKYAYVQRFAQVELGSNLEPRLCKTQTDECRGKHPSATSPPDYYVL